MAVSVSRSIRTLPILVAAKTRSRGTGVSGREARKDERAERANHQAEAVQGWS